MLRRLTTVCLSKKRPDWRCAGTAGPFLLLDGTTTNQQGQPTSSSSHRHRAYHSSVAVRSRTASGDLLVSKKKEDESVSISDLFTRIQRRSLAFVTGHKKTTKKNKKKQRAKNRKTQARQQHKEKQQRIKDGLPRMSQKKILREQRINQIAQSPDYPLPRDYQEAQTNDDEETAVPPVMLSSTASAHVFIAKIACQDARMNPAHLFQGIQPNPPLEGNFYEFLQPAFQDGYPPTDNQPEVAFLGRSNVGKSSLINAIMRQNLAVTSKTPGRTQSEYYYGWIPSSTKLHGDQKQYVPRQATGFLVDLPGYGYAAAPDAKVGEWQDATQQFLLRRRDAGTLRRVFLLQDARLQVPQNLDHTVAAWMDKAEIPYTIVLTKADTVTADGKRTAGIIKHVNLNALRFHQQYLEHLQDMEDDVTGDESTPTRKTVCMSPFVHATSSRKNTGIAELLPSIFSEFEHGSMDESSDASQYFGDDAEEEDEEGHDMQQQEEDDGEYCEEGYDDDDDDEEDESWDHEEDEYIYKGRPPKR